MGIQSNKPMMSGKCALGVIPPRDVVLESHSTCSVKEINNQSIQHIFSTRISTHIEILYYNTVASLMWKLVFVFDKISLTIILKQNKNAQILKFKT